MQAEVAAEKKKNAAAAKARADVHAA